MASQYVLPSLRPQAGARFVTIAYSPGRNDPEVMGYSMRTDRFRYTEWRKYRGGQIVARELYDHDRDPQENVNLAEDPAMTETVRQLATSLSETIAP